MHGLAAICHAARKGGHMGSRCPNHRRASALLTNFHFFGGGRLGPPRREHPPAPWALSRTVPRPVLIKEPRIEDRRARIDMRGTKGDRSSVILKSRSSPFDSRFSILDHRSSVPAVHLYEVVKSPSRNSYHASVYTPPASAFARDYRPFCGAVTVTSP
jgi:hypothetical protein